MSRTGEIPCATNNNELEADVISFIFRRVMLGVVVLCLAVSSLYILVQAAPGDPAAAMLGPRASPELREAYRVKLGLDQPLPVQIGKYFLSLAQGDLGTDLKSRRPVTETLSIHLPRTIELLCAALFIAASLGIPLGCMAAVWRRSWFDRIVGILSVSIIAMPPVVLSIFGMLIFAVHLGWLPAIGGGEDGGFWSRMHHLVLPAFAVGIGWVGYLARLVRASMIEVLSANYIRNARAFGLPEWRITVHYALRVAIAPTVTVLGVGVGIMLGSAVFAEIVFARPGIGKVMYDAVILRNYPLSMGAVLAATAILITTTTLSDILNVVIDPQLLEKGGDL